MGKLSSAIVQRKLAPLRDVEEALAHQVLYGGDLATNLLEQTPKLDEKILAELLAETSGLPAAPPGSLARSATETLRLLPGDVALRHGVYPLSSTGGALRIAVSEPLRPEVEQDLGFGLGLRLEQCIAPLVRIRQAIGRDYGLLLDRRTQRVLAKLEGRPDPSPSVAPAPLAGAPDITSLPRPPSIPPFGLPLSDMTPLYATARPVDLGVVPDPAASPRGVTPRGVRGVFDVKVEGDVSVHERVTAPPPAVTISGNLGAPSSEAVPSTTPGVVIDAGEPSSAGAAPPVEAPAPRKEPHPAEPAPAETPRRTAAVAPALDEEPPKTTPTNAPPPPPAPTTALPVPPSRRATGQFAINLGAWGAESRQTERRNRSKHRGPYTAAATERDLFAAEDRETILTAFFDFACQYFEYSALFVIHGDLAEGRDAYGPGAARRDVAGIGVPLDLPSSLRTARTEGHFIITALAREGLDGRLVADLKRRPDKKALLLPVQVRGRTVLILYGDEGADDVDLSLIGDVIAFAPLVATALEALILRRKTAVQKAAAEVDTRKPPSVHPAPPSRHMTRPSREDRAELLTQALLGGGLRTPSERPRPPSQAPRPVLPAKEAPAAEAGAAPPTNVVPVPGPAPTGDSSKRPSTKPAIPSVRVRSSVPQQAGRTGTPPQGTVRLPSVPPHEDAQPIPLSRRMAARPTPDEEVPDDDGWEAPGGGPSPAKREEEPGDGPEISIGVAEVEDLTSDIEDLGPSSVAVVAAPQRLHKRYSSDELRLPTVILNIDNDLEVLAKRVEAGDERAMERLSEIGAAAASILVSRLAGTAKPSADKLESRVPASQRGPLLRTLVRIGLPAVPFIAVRSNDADPHVRAVATELLGEIPSSDSAQAIARRVTDGNAEVRRAALDAGRLLQIDEESRTMLRDRVMSAAEETASKVEARVAAIEALAHFRDPRAVPRLARLAAQNDEAGQSAQWALGLITRQAFGRDAAAWDAWWKANAEKHRIEWLVDALMHDEAEIRRAAGEELKALTKEYFGYYDDLAKSERQKAQNRYREWWETTGKARFSGK